MSESSIRFERKDSYTILQNSMLRDPRLSLKTKGLFALIISLPEAWNYSVSGLATVAGVGKDAIRSALGEMEQAGYLTREQSHGERGKFGGNVYVISEKSLRPLSENPTTEAPLSDKPLTGEPSTGNPTLLNKDISSKDLSNIPPKSPKGEEGKKKSTLPDEVRDMLNAYVENDKELAEEMVAFMEIRRSLKAVNSPRAISALLKELDKLSGGKRMLKLELVRQSVTNSWKSVFPIRGVRNAMPPKEATRHVV